MLIYCTPPQPSKAFFPFPSTISIFSDLRCPFSAVCSEIINGAVAIFVRKQRYRESTAFNVYKTKSNKETGLTPSPPMFEKLCSIFF
jgi:hypothetical protein